MDMGRGANCLTTRSPGASSTRRGNAIWNGMVKATGATTKAVTGTARLGARAFRAYNGFLSEQFGMDRRQRLMSFGIISGAGLMALSAPVLGIAAGAALMAPQMKAMRDKKLRKPIGQENGLDQQEISETGQPIPPVPGQQQNFKKEQIDRQVKEDGLTDPERMLLQKIQELSQENARLSSQFDQFVQQETEKQKAKAQQAVANFEQTSQTAQDGNYQVQASEEAVQEIHEQDKDNPLTAEQINQMLGQAANYLQETEANDFDIQQATQQISPGDQETAIQMISLIENEQFLDGQLIEQAEKIAIAPESEPAFNNEDGEQITLPADFYPPAEKNIKSRDINETELLYRAYQICCSNGKISATSLMKPLGIGYPKAKQLIARLIANGMLPPSGDENGSVPIIPLFSKQINRNLAKQLSKNNHPVICQARQTVAADALNNPGRKLTPKILSEQYQMVPAVGRQILRDLIDNKIINKNRVNLQTSGTGKNNSSVKQSSSLERVEVSSKLNPPQVSGKNFNKQKYLEYRKQTRDKTGNGIMALKPHFSEHILNGDANGWEIKSVPANFLSEGGRVAIYTSTPISAVSGYMDIDKIYRGSPEEVWEQIKDQPDFGYTEQEFWGHCGHKNEVCVFKASNVQRLEEPVSLAEVGHVNETGKQKTIIGSHGIQKDDPGLNKLMDIFDNHDASLAEKNNGIVPSHSGSETPAKMIPIALKSLAKEEKKDNTTYSAMKRYRSDQKSEQSDRQVAV
jgi:predicted transcriptional regulator